MAVDIRAVLRRVVDEVFDERAVVAEEDYHEAPRAYRVLLSNRKASNGKERQVSLVATYEWFSVHVTDLDVGILRFDYDDVESEKELELRELAHLARAYLEGEGKITYRPSLLHRRPHPTLTIETGGIRWKLGRRISSEEQLNS